MTLKFKNEIQSLLEKDVIDIETAHRIQSYYASNSDEKPNRLFTIFGILGASLVGLGIILILAHNWNDFPKTLKTVFAFAPLLIGQAFVGFSLFKNKGKAWIESSGAFLFFAVGSSIALVSQIYNIPGDLSNYLLTWMLLCLPLVYLLNSDALLLLCLVFVTYFGWDFGYGYSSTPNTHWWYLLIFAALIPQYIKLLKSRKTSNFISICNWLLPLSIVVALGAFTETSSGYGFLMYVILFGVLYNLGRLKYFNAQKLRRNGYLIIGSLGTVITLLITSFKWLWKDLVSEIYIFSIQETAIALILFLAAIILFFKSIKQERNGGISLFQIVFILFTALFYLGYVTDFVPVVIINALLLILGINAIKIGAQKFHFGVLNYGLLIITSLIVCRFFDTDMTFVTRGLLFVVVGAGFFATNYVMLKKQNKKTNSISK